MLKVLLVIALLAVSLVNIGSIYDDQGGVTEAMDYYKNSLKIYEEIGNKSGITICLYSIGNLLNKQGEVKEALIYGLESLAISKEIGSPVNIKKASNLLSKVYEKQGKGIKALEMYTSSNFLFKITFGILTLSGFSLLEISE